MRSRRCRVRRIAYSGEDITVEGKLSPQLYASMSGAGQTLITQYFSPLHIVQVHAEQFGRLEKKPSGVGTALSGGVDSFQAIHEYLYKNKTAPEAEITHLTYAGVGAVLKAGMELHNRRVSRLAPLCRKLERPLVEVVSNVTDFYQNRIHFLKPYILPNSSVALATQNGFGVYYIASSHRINARKPRVCYDIGEFETALIPHLNTESLASKLVGSELKKQSEFQRYPIPTSFSKCASERPELVLLAPNACGHSSHWNCSANSTNTIRYSIMRSIGSTVLII